LWPTRFQNGSVKKSKDRRYWIGQWREDGPDGKRVERTKVLGKASKISKSEAREKIAEFVKPVNARAAQALNIHSTLKEFLENSYLPFYKRKWKRSTAMTNVDRINHHIVEAFGNYQMRSLTREELQTFLDYKAKLSFSTVDHLRRDLSQIFHLALAEGVVTKNPAALLFTPRECSRPEKKTMTLEEVTKACNALPLRERLIVKMAVLAGMRPGEIFGLRRSHVALTHACISQRVYRGDIDTPKTDKSKRKAGLPEGLRQDIAEWLAASPDTGPDGWLFPSENLKTPLAKDNVWRRNIAPALKAIGLGWVNFHVLRRSHSSLMRDHNVDPKVVADQQGHTLDVNLNVYTETTLERRIEAVQQLESALVN
jgi:integrase